MNKLTSPKQMKNLYVLTTNELEKDQFIYIIANRVADVKTCIQNGSIVRKSTTLRFPKND